MAVDTSYADLSSPDTFVPGVPFETFDRLRKENPVFFHEEQDGPGFWCVTRYEDLVAVNRDNQLFSSNKRTALFMEQDEEMLAQQRLMMLNMDPPMHTRYRLLVNKGFTPRRVSQLEDTIRRQTNEIIDTVSEKGECDFVTDISVTKSASPFSQTESMMPLVWRRMVSSNCPTRRGVKPLLTSSRYRVCMGGSMFSIISRCWASISSSDSMNRAVLRFEENSWLSRLTATRSS